MTYQPPTQLESFAGQLPGVIGLALIVALFVIYDLRNRRRLERHKTRRDTERHSNERGGDTHP